MQQRASSGNSRPARWADTSEEDEDGKPWHDDYAARHETIMSMIASQSSVKVTDATGMRNDAAQVLVTALGAKAGKGEALLRVSGWRGMITGVRSVQDDARFLLALALEDLETVCATSEVVLGVYTTREGVRLIQLFFNAKTESASFMDGYYHSHYLLGDTSLRTEEVTCKGQRMEIVLVFPTVASCTSLPERLATESMVTTHVAPYFISTSMSGVTTGNVLIIEQAQQVLANPQSSPVAKKSAAIRLAAAKRRAPSSGSAAMVAERDYNVRFKQRPKSEVLRFLREKFGRPPTAAEVEEESRTWILCMLMPTGSREEIDKVVEYIATLPEGELALPVMGTLPQYSLQGYGRDGGLLLTADLTKARQIQEPCRALLATQLAERAHRVANCSVIVSADGIEGFNLRTDDLDQVIGVRTLFHINMPGGEVLLVYPTVADAVQVAAEIALANDMGLWPPCMLADGAAQPKVPCRRRLASVEFGHDNKKQQYVALEGGKLQLKDGAKPLEPTDVLATAPARGQMMQMQRAARMQIAAVSAQLAAQSAAVEGRVRTMEASMAAQAAAVKEVAAAQAQEATKNAAERAARAARDEDFKSLAAYARAAMQRIDPDGYAAEAAGVAQAAAASTAAASGAGAAGGVDGKSSAAAATNYAATSENGAAAAAAPPQVTPEKAPDQTQGGGTSTDDGGDVRMGSGAAAPGNAPSS